MLFRRVFLVTPHLRLHIMIQRKNLRFSDPSPRDFMSPPKNFLFDNNLKYESLKHL
jgi:hypothetical protein